MQAKPLSMLALEDVVAAISMRINHIETGTTTYSAIDAKNYNDSLDMSDSRDRARVVSINPLSRSQRDTIARLEDARAVFKQDAMNLADEDLDEEEEAPVEKRAKSKKAKKKTRK